MKKMIVLLLAIALTSCTWRENKEMIIVPENMNPISLYYAPREAVVSIGMQRTEIEQALGKEISSNVYDGHFNKVYTSYDDNLFVYYVEDVAAQFLIGIEECSQNYFAFFGLNLYTDLKTFYKLFHIPDHMKTKNTIEDISVYEFAIYQSAEGFTLELLPDYEAYDKFRGNAITTNEYSYYLRIFLGRSYFDYGGDISYIILGKANLPD